MNKSNQSKVFQSKQTFLPSCRVCIAAGQADINHWTKTREGKTSCPFLLSQHCRYCDGRGHTVKYCPVLKERNDADQKQTVTICVSISPAASEPVKRNSSNPFDLLGNDSDDEFYVTPKQHGKKKSKQTNNNTQEQQEQQITWASIAAKPKPETKAIQTPTEFLTEYITKEHPEANAAKIIDMFQKEFTPEEMVDLTTNFTFLRTELKGVIEFLEGQNQVKEVKAPVVKAPVVKPLIKATKQQLNWADSDSEDEEQTLDSW
jgi:hypothetical protein